LIALAVAGCANTGVPEAQTSVGGALSRPKTVLVGDLVFSPDVAVVDRDLATRLERTFGNDLTNDVIESLGAKRVNAEIVAAIIVVLHAAGLNAQPGDQEELTRNKGALAIAGRLHAGDQGKRPQRNPVGFGTGSSVVADITVSQVSEGQEQQLLTFTAQAPSGRQPDAAITGPDADAAITAVVAAKSVPDVNLSPDAEALARGLGRAVADRIIAYAAQQGWQTTPVLAAPPGETKPAKKKPENLPVAAARPSGSRNQANTIPCAAFTKNNRGNWYVRGPITFDLGNAENQTLQDQEIPPKFFTVGGVDLYEAIEKRCGGKPRP
jgi:hypothetical protein